MQVRCAHVSVIARSTAREDGGVGASRSDENTQSVGSQQATSSLHDRKVNPVYLHIYNIDSSSRIAQQHLT